MGMGTSPTLHLPPTVNGNGYLFAQGDRYLRYLIAGDDSLDSLAFDVGHPGKLQGRIVEVSGIVGAMNPDTSAFQRRGGKLIVLQGLVDDAVSPDATIAYYRGQVQRYGQRAVDAYFRLYTVPGFAHGSGAFVPAWPALDILDRWVSAGIAPQDLVGSDANEATRGRSRPLCRYPGFPAYLGKGDGNLASSYVCRGR
jgi:feruloyl esterase